MQKFTDSWCRQPYIFDYITMQRRGTGSCFYLEVGRLLRRGSSQNLE